MQWEIDNRRPVYVQIMEHMRSAVLSNEYPPGSRIPSVRELATLANVNPNTMQRAMAELEHQGLLVSTGTLGRFVTEDKSVIDTLRQQVIQEVVQACAARFRELGLNMQAAAQLLSKEGSV